ncbi:MAG: TolC family protein [Oligoflexia bacterium]|nr:TolC family protein [Oligoflexia bacterium]
MKISKIPIFFMLTICTYAYSETSVDASASTSTSTSTSLTLQDAYKLALERNETIPLQESKVMQLNEKINQATGAILPRFSALAGLNRQDVPENSSSKENQSYLKLNATQPLFRGLREFSTLKITKLNYRAGEEQTKQQKLALYLQVSQLFYSILTVERDLINLHEQFGLTNLRIKELKERAQVGRTRKAEVLTAESQRALITSQIDSSKWQLIIYKETFAYLTGISSKNMNNNDIKLVENLSLLPNSSNIYPLDQYLDKINNRPDIKSLQTQVESSEEGILNAKGAYFPSIDLSANYYLQRSPTTTNTTIRTSKWDLSVNLTMPLFDGMVTKSDVAEASDKLKEKKLILSQNKRQAEMEIRVAYDKIKSGHSQLQAIEEAIKAADKAYKEQLKDYRNGLANNLDVLQAQNTLLDTKKNYQRTKYQILMSYAELQVASGATSL